MKKKIILLLLLLIPTSVHALCNDSEKIRLNKLASNVTYSYTYEESNQDISYTVTISNLSKDLIIRDRYNGKDYRGNGQDIVIKGYAQQTTAKFYIYADNQSCYSSSILTNAISFPAYNPYYNDDVCKKAQGYIYCRKWIIMPYSYEEFKSKVNKYISENTVTKEEIYEIEPGPSLFDIIGIIYVKTYFIILPLIILICLIIIYRLNQKNKLV